MGYEKPLQPHEIRIIKMNRKSTLDLIWEILRPKCYEKLCLSRDPNHNEQICIDRIFDVSQYEMYVFAHRNEYEIDKDAVIAYIKNLSITPTESLRLNANKKTIYHSIQDASFIIDTHKKNSIDRYENYLCSVWQKICCLLDSNIKPLQKYEIRVIRLSKQAIHELIWEHFMEIGNKVMNLPEDDFSVIFSMHVVGVLDELSLYVVNLNEASDSVFEKVDAYCDKEVPFSMNSFSKESANEQQYISVILPIQ